ncbi:MAG TPA: F0F1 ATP synthase subunit gamma [Candidatus Wallbacteria bacterium]|nr:F0F1 ATP synthase subunit gamma [Candidatus Wallbacteria bacterium]
MSETLQSLSRKITGAKDLESVVRTMKVLAASSIGQYERAIRSLDDYYRAVEMGLSVYFRQNAPENARVAPDEKEEFRNKKILKEAEAAHAVNAVIFGSDQGLVGQFNDALTEFAMAGLSGFSGPKKIWAVGERIHASLENAGLKPVGLFDVPGSVAAITQLISRIIIECETDRAGDEETSFYIFYNRPKHGAIYEHASARILPLDEAWRRDLLQKPWPTKKRPEVMRSSRSILLALVREYLFVVLFRACAESLASENASRLAAMQRAEKNIDEMLEDLNRSFHRLRQSSIDEELFDVTSGFEALAGRRGK